VAAHAAGVATPWGLARSFYLQSRASCCTSALFADFRSAKSYLPAIAFAKHSHLCFSTLEPDPPRSHALTSCALRGAVHPLFSPLDELPQAPMTATSDATPTIRAQRKSLLTTTMPPNTNY
jgi:hypothetical protein